MTIRRLRVDRIEAQDPALDEVATWYETPEAWTMDV